MSRISFIISISVVFLSSCFLFQNTPKVGKEYTTESGLKYTILEKSRGAKPEKGQVVKVHYTGTLTNGNKFDSSHDRGQPLPFKLGMGQVIKGWDEGIALLNEGSKAKFVIPPELGYGSRSMSSIPANPTLIFEVELVKVMPRPKPFDVAGLDTIKMESGLKYIKLNSTNDKEAEAFRTVSVHYTGFLVDGTIFDSSVEREVPFSFTLGKGQVIKGWDEGIAKLKIGEKSRLIIPPQLGYGERGSPPSIPPNAT